MKRLGLIICFALAVNSCAAPGQVNTNTPAQQQAAYPPVIEDTPARRQATQDAWKQFLAEWRLPETAPDVSSVTGAPRALPPALAGRININTKPGTFGDLEAKEALRRFIERVRGVLSSDPIIIGDLSLVSFANEGNFYRAVYWQMSYPYQIAEGYGELRFVIGKNGELMQMSSSLIPTVALPTRAEIQTDTIYDRLLNRGFTYSNLAGQPQSYRATRREDIKIGELIVYPILKNNRLEIHLAYSVVVGSGTTWTVYIDAINGDELGVKQNFAT